MILVTLRTKRWETFKAELSGWIRFIVGICVTQYLLNAIVRVKPEYE